MPHARRVGAMVPEAAELRVHSVYRRVVNLRSDRGQTLISLVLDDTDMAATAVLVDQLPPAVEVGVRGSIASGVLALEELPGSGLGWRVAFVDAPRWEGTVAKLQERRMDASSMLKALETILLECGRSGGLLGLVVPAADNPLCGFARRLLQGPSGESGNPCLSGLVGLGVGLTPSGDDFLTGLMLARQLWDPSGIETGTASTDRDAVRKRLHATTDAGATLLTAAIQDRFPYYLIHLVDSLDSTLSGNCDLLDHGQTSATDAAVGMWWYLGKRNGFRPGNPLSIPT